MSSSPFGLACPSQSQTSKLHYQYLLKSDWSQSSNLLPYPTRGFKTKIDWYSKTQIQNINLKEFGLTTT